jgi:hypothetical protein
MQIYLKKTIMQYGLPILFDGWESINMIKITYFKTAHFDFNL